MLRLQHFKLRAYIWLQFRGAFYEFETLHLLDGGHRWPQRERMCLVSVAVREVVVLEVLRYFGRCGAYTERHIRRREALGGNENVGLHAPMVNGKPLACSSPSGHHFVVDEQYAVAVADLAEARKIFGRRNQHAVGAHHGLDNNGGHVALVANHVLNVVGAGDVAAWIGVLDWAVVAVGLRRKHNVPRARTIL